MKGACGTYLGVTDVREYRGEYREPRGSARRNPTATLREQRTQSQRLQCRRLAAYTAQCV